MSEGKEQQISREILATKDGVNQKIAKSSEINGVLYKDNPRLVPPEFNPQCIETYIEVNNTQEQRSSKNTKTTKGKTAKTTKEKVKTSKKVCAKT